MYLKENGKLWLATGDERIYLEPAMLCRHGMIAGATGTGKTVTLKVVAESLSDMGVPVFLADIKGDLSGMLSPGTENKHIRRSIDTMGIENFTYASYTARFFDVYGELGHPVRTTISDMGPELLSRLLGLNDTQSGVLRIIFRIADDNGLLLLDLKDLRSMTQRVGDNAAEYKLRYGNVAPQSVGAIQRALLRLEDEGGNIFFGEPALDIADWIDRDENGRGVMNLLECRRLFTHPLLYSTFLLWMLSELYELLPEAGELEKPKLAFFFDEAHLLFNDAPKALLEKIEQVVRLIRSKGVSVWFISQSPADIPETVLSQLGNRVQHALRAYTPNEQKALRYAARSFRVNPGFDTERALRELGVGEAVISALDEKGVPTVAQKAGILPPRSSMNAADDSMIAAAVEKSPLRSKYSEMIDRRSAYEIITEQNEKEAEEAARAAKTAERESAAAKRASSARSSSGRSAHSSSGRSAHSSSGRSAHSSSKSSSARSAASVGQSVIGKTVSSAANTIGRELGRQLVRGILGSFKK